MSSSTHPASPATHQLLLAQDHEESEWWYYHGFLEAPQRRFAFHLAFFRFRIGDIRLAGLLPLHLAAEHFRVAHFALTDLDGGQFHYSFRRSLWGDAGASATHYRTWMEDWSAQETPDGHHLRASIPNAQLHLDVSSQPLKPPLQRRWDAHHSQPMRPHTTEFCLTRMQAQGNLLLGGEEMPVSGHMWLDREIGDFPLKHNVTGWDWFAVQLENGAELRIYQLHPDASSPGASSIACIDPSGTTTWLAGDEFHVTALEHWTSPRTGIAYPVKWSITAPPLHASIEIAACLRCNELDTRGAGNVIYWEGPALVTGTLHGAPASGRAFVEVVGRGNGHKLPGVFDFTTNRLGVWDSLLNEIRQHLFGPGISVSEDGS